jgi:small subunit ribosomal protein S4
MKKKSPQCRLCRRAGEKLFLKGERCYTPKCSIVKRNYPPGFHGPSSRGEAGEYGLRLREKQKAKRIYGLRERQFKNYFIEASKKKGVTGDLLLQFLERRLDNVIFRLGFAKSRRLARQLVNHGHVWVNKHMVNIPSYMVKEGDAIEVKEVSLKKNYFTNLAKSKVLEGVPSWLKTAAKNLKGEVVSLPKSEDIDRHINTQFIVEHYSK